MSKQSRFETKMYRGCELRLHAGRGGQDQPWQVRIDIHGRSGAKTRLLGRSEGWHTWEEAVIDGFQMGRESVDASLAGDAAEAERRGSAVPG